MLLSRVLLYSSISFLTACAIVNGPQATITSSPELTATLDLTQTLEITLSGSGDYAFPPPFEGVEAVTLDSEPITGDITILFRIAPEKINLIEEQWEMYRNNIVIPILRETIVHVVSQYAARDTYDKRRIEMEENLWNDLTTKLSEEDIVVQEVLLRDIQFSPEFNHRIEEEIVATQYASLTAETNLSTMTP